jgi:hypothetical protein
MASDNGSNLTISLTAPQAIVEGYPRSTHIFYAKQNLKLLLRQDEWKKSKKRI